MLSDAKIIGLPPYSVYSHLGQLHAACPQDMLRVTASCPCVEDGWMTGSQNCCILLLIVMEAGIAQSVWWLGWRLRGRVIVGLFSAGSKDFFPSRAFTPALGLTQPAVQCALGAFSPGVMRPWREADFSSQSSTRFKNEWSYRSTSAYS